MTGLQPGTRYEFRVSARSSAGSSSRIEAFATTEEPGATGQHHDTNITISGLSSKIPPGGRDRFTVVAELEIGSHTISVSASGGVGFNSSCSDTSESESVENDGFNLVDHTYYWSLTLYACGCSSGTVSASVSGASDSQYVTVKPVPTPTVPATIPPTVPPTPTDTPTPVPPDTPAPTPVPLPPALAPNVLSIGPTDVNEVLLRWNTIYTPVANQYRVDRYRVRMREILEVGELP